MSDILYSGFDFAARNERMTAENHKAQRVTVLSASLLVRNPALWAGYIIWKKASFEAQGVVDDLDKCEEYLCQEHRSLDDYSARQDLRELLR